MRIVGLVVLCGPRELDSVARYQTDFVLLGSAVCRCAMSPRDSSLAWHMRTCYACMCEVSIRVRSKIGAPTTVSRLQRNACCVHPRGMVLYGGTSAMGAGSLLEFA